MKSFDICIVGGCGHVGLPLGMAFADQGQNVVLYDINEVTIAKVNNGVVPFKENGAEPVLKRVLKKKKLLATNDPDVIGNAKVVVTVIGTPVDEHLNPNFTAIHRAIDKCESQLRDGQILILRSTVFPGISRHIQRHLAKKNLDIQVAFCPERVAQGYSLQEFREFPQIISAFDPDVVDEVRDLFQKVAPEVIEMEPMEAELAKLMTNAWRYIQFAIVNQFYMIATQNNLNFDRILHGCRHRFPRLKGMPGPGFSAGPCLVKDTMQLAAFSENNFILGHAAMLINEGLPGHLLTMAKRQCNLSHMTAGVLGMAFKAESDDARDSLSYKLRKLLLLEARAVLCTDPFVTTDPSLVPLDKVMSESDILFVGAPHSEYRKLKIPRDKIVVDVWSCLNTTSDQRIDLIAAGHNGNGHL